jgi:alpha-tubulin suppressor-like RCC1 family protein
MKLCFGQHFCKHLNFIFKKLFFSTTLIMSFLSLLGCGSGGGSDADQPENLSKVYVGGAVAGASGSLSLVLNNDESIELDGDGEFSFLTELSTGEIYTVEISTIPEGQRCALSGEIGTIETNDIVTVSVVCTDRSFTISGNMTGLNGNLQVALNNSEEVSLTENGEFSFNSILFFGDEFSITIKQLPDFQQCEMTNNNALVSDDSVYGVTIHCSTTLSAPLVSNIWPTVFRSGQEVKISGANLGYVNATYEDTELVFSLQSDNELRFTAPEKTGGLYELILDNVAGSTVQTLLHGIPTGNILSVSTGSSHSCAVKSNGQVTCWGSNDRGRLGNGTETDSRSPVPVEGIDSAISVSAGYDHSCAVLDNGTVQCWGYNSYGQLGDGSDNRSSTPVTVVGIDSAVSVSSGSEFSCAVLLSGGVECWGYNAFSQLGGGNVDSNKPKLVFDHEEGEVLSNVVEVSAGSFHVCARLETGAVKCWGYNSSGQLGNGSSINTSSPVAVQGIESAVKVSSGLYHSCAVLSSGVIQCWGKNSYGQLGNGLDENSNIPVSVNDINNAISVGGGFASSCALLASGNLKCWGDNGLGSLGNGTTESSSTPVNVVGLSSIQSLSVGDHHSCALSDTGNTRCWGDDSSGQRGDGINTKYIATPFTISEVGLVENVDVGYQSVCANTKTGIVECWGDNSSGQLGISDLENRIYPTTVDGVTDVTDIASGGNISESHSCAITSEGAVVCWGNNDYGQLGNGTTESSSIPLPVNDIYDAIDVSVSSRLSCALLAGGNIQCWGSNYNGRLGNGESTDSNIPVTVSGIDNAVAVDNGGGHSCALLETGIVECWGSISSGPWLGDGESYSSSLPVQVVDLNNVVSIAIGGSHSCALISGGTIKCWGDNRSGQLGDGRTISASIPTLVNEIDSATSISAGNDHTCATLSSGQLKCWGSNSLGKLGNGSTERSSIPVLVNGIDSVVDVSLGYESSCAKLDNGKIQCWGDNSSGQLTISHQERTVSEVLELNDE